MASGGDVPDLEMHYEDILIDDDDDDNDDDSEGWNEMDADCDSHISCLFCSQSFKTMAVALEHCKLEHKFNLTALKTKLNMDCYSYICLVNYVRREGVNSESIMNCKDTPWAKDEYLTPSIPDDPWLMFDFEGLESPLVSAAVTPDGGYHVVNSENGLITLTEQHFSQMQHTIQCLSAQVREKDEALSLAAEQITKMKTVTQQLVCGDALTEDRALRDTVAKMKLSDDCGYFRSYSHYGIHHEMLSDSVRMSSYHDAITKNADCLAGKTVLDVGCGTAILSMFAAKAGAEKVYGVDQSDIIFQAMDIVRENKLEDKVELLRGTVEGTPLPVPQVDVIVSEWMGYLLLFEGMLDSVVWARDKYLRPGGVLMPNRCSISIVGISDQAGYHDMLGFWSDVYGFKMSCLAKEVFREAVVSTVTGSTVVTAPAVVLELDLYTCDIASTNFTSDFTLTALADGTMTCLAGYFDAMFDLGHPVTLSTSPHQTPTHWKQTLFYLPKPIHVKTGEQLTGTISCKRPSDDIRALEITLTIQGQKNKYELS